jgi:hypothetical protein
MEASLKLAVTVRQIPKLGLTAEQCEDAWAVSSSGLRLAVADGATDSYASGRFARLLTEGFVEDSGPRTADEFAPWSRARSAAWVEATRLDGLPWYKQEKARLGAHSTFLGLEIEPGCARSLELGGPRETEQRGPGGLALAGNGVAGSARSLAYRALAVGDVCLFHVRGDRMLSAMPLERPEDFGVQPALIATSRTYPGPGVEALVSWSGEIAPGDTLVIASDAVARWFLVSTRDGEKPWQAIADADEQGFAALVDRLRREDRMRNDDVTVLSIDAEAVPPVSQPTRPSIAEPKPHRSRRKGGRRQIERAVAVSLGAGAVAVVVAVLGSPRTRGMLGASGARL